MTNDLGVDYISRQEVINLMMQKWGENFSGDDAMQESIDAIRVMPSVTPQEPKRGHWIDTDEWRETVDGFEQWGYFRKCSKCGYVFKFLEIDNYCPNCGCRMVELQERED